MTKQQREGMNTLIGAGVLIVGGILVASMNVSIVERITDQLRSDTRKTAENFVWALGILFIVGGVVEVWFGICRLLWPEMPETPAPAVERTVADRLMEAAIVVGGIVTGFVGIYLTIRTHTSSERFFISGEEPFASLPLFVSALAFGLLAIALFRRRS